MNKPNETKKIFIGLIIFLSLLIVISAIFVIISICFTVSMINVYPKPLDSFWSFELSATLIIVFSILLVASVVGIVLCLRKLKKLS